MSEQEKDIKVINARLREINKEFQELSSLKKKIVAQNAVSNFSSKYGEYKFIVKDNVNQDLDFDKLITENELKIQNSKYGMLCAVYKVGPNTVGYHIAKTEEEADQIRVVQNLFSVGEVISKGIEENKTYTAQEILELYDGARSGQQLTESENTEEVPS